MKVSKDSGIVIRKKVIDQKAVDLAPLMKAFNFEKYFDESEDFVSLGPFFGSESADVCMKSLQLLGLTYIDDFFIVEAYFPEWCGVEVFHVEGA